MSVMHCQQNHLCMDTLTQYGGDACQQIYILKLTHVGDAVSAESLMHGNSPRMSVMHVSRSTSESEQSAMAFIISCKHEKNYVCIERQGNLCHTERKTEYCDGRAIPPPAMA
jgi:hypothetical protein